jgi:inward rectifier potassium channel
MRHASRKSTKPVKSISLRPAGADYEIRVIGSRVRPLRDLYFALLRWSWPRTISVIASGYLIANALYAVAYELVGGVQNAKAGSFADAFFFSVQTMGTIGYGAMYPKSLAANLLVVSESLAALVLTALATGLVFAKFSRPNSRIVFSDSAVICPFNGVPTFMCRVGNERGNAIVDAQFHMIASRTEHTSEGELFYRAYDMTLVRDRALGLNRSFSISHRIDETSPLFEQSPESLTAMEYEIQIMVVGLDDALMQTVHGSHVYYAPQIVFGARLVDVLSEGTDGSLILNLKHFHAIEPSVPIPTFPYPRRE